MDKAFLEDTRNEVLISSAVLGVWGLMLLLPNSVLQNLPAMNFMSGLFSNVVGYVGMKALSAPLSHTVVGLLMIGVAASPFAWKSRGTVLSTLVSASVSVYGVLSLLYLIVQPTPLFASQVMGIGLQTIIFGLVATVLYKEVLKQEDFSVEYDRGLYAAAFVHVLTGIAALTFFTFFQSGISIIYPAIGTAIGLLLVYSSLELLERTTEGIWISMTVLTVLVLLSLTLFSSTLAGIFFLATEVVIWERKEMFEDLEAPIEYFRNNLDY